MGTDRKHAWPLAASVMAAAILIAPLWCVASPAMPDYPAHLATFHLLAGGASHYYRIHWAFIPNLAAEIAVPALARFVALGAATKLFLSAAVAMWVMGPALIHRALYGRFGVAPLIAAFFAYNANFMWGFLNYYFAAGLALLVFAAWIATENRRGVFSLAGFMLAVTIIYFCHVFAAFALLMMIGCFELGVLMAQRPVAFRNVPRQLLSTAIIFIPCAFAFVFLKPHGADSGHLEFNFAASAMDRVEAMLQWNYDNPAFSLLAVIAAFLLIGLWRRWIVLHRKMIFVLIAFALGAALAPEWAMGGWGVDLRLPAILCVLVFAAADLQVPPLYAKLLAVVCMGTLIYCAATLAGNWRYYDRQYSEFRAASQSIVPNAKLLTVLDGDSIGKASDQPYWHMAEFAIIDRGAFTPLMFTTRGQHVVRLPRALQAIAASSAQEGSPPDTSELNDLAAGSIDGDIDIAEVFPYLMYYQCHFDQAVIIHLNGNRSPLPNILHLRLAGSFFSLYDIQRTGCPKQ
ncbi:MAG TPA: hypothetical protein VIJ62_12960 [Rhizomicrobium sp.]